MIARAQFWKMAKGPRITAVGSISTASETGADSSIGADFGRTASVSWPGCILTLAVLGAASRFPVASSVASGIAWAIMSGN